MSPALLIPAGAGLFLLGLSFLFPPVQAIDARLFRWLHRPLRRRPFVALFRFLWPLGTTPMAVLLLLLAASALGDWRRGLSLALVWGAAGLLELALKRLVRRARPFQAQPGAKMLQPRRPPDSSFPSGDTLRAWFFALALAAIFPPSASLPAVLAGLAVLVSLGRMALGVHYPLDVVAGAGLGVLAFGVWLAVVG